MSASVRRDNECRRFEDERFPGTPVCALAHQMSTQNGQETGEKGDYSDWNIYYPILNLCGGCDWLPLQVTYFVSSSRCQLKVCCCENLFVFFTTFFS